MSPIGAPKQVGHTNHLVVSSGKLAPLMGLLISHHKRQLAGKRRQLVLLQTNNCPLDHLSIRINYPSQASIVSLHAASCSFFFRFRRITVKQSAREREKTTATKVSRLNSSPASCHYLLLSLVLLVFSQWPIGSPSWRLYRADFWWP